MKHLLLILCLLGGLLFPAHGQAGRLNFMLTNLTGVDLVDVRIAPTAFPGMISENLLNTNLEPCTRLYIGPNYYGDQRYWNIQLTWANGFQWTWTHNQLTRYNAYTVYTNSYGVRMRQGYERAFARYDQNGRMFAGAQGNVSVGIPEKTNTAIVADAGQVTQSTRKTRDLVFDEDEADGTNPAAESKNADEEAIAVKTTVELTRDGKTSTVLPSESFKSGDKVRLLFSSSKDGYVYWLARGTSGQYQVLFPGKSTGMNNKITKNTEYTVPTRGGWRFDQQNGTENLVCLLSATPMPEVDKAVALSASGDKEQVSQLLASVLADHEKQRTTRDLVFEEEDEVDVNTKTQKNGNGAPFVAQYELEHK